MLKYNRNSHSKYLIKLHFVLAVKYRKKLLTKIINDDMIEIITKICFDNGFIIDAIQSDIDHIHILLDVKPIHSAYFIIHKIKSISTYCIYQKHYISLKKHFWKENTFWSNGYFVCSTGDACTETIKKYIEQQG